MNSFIEVVETIKYVTNDGVQHDDLYSAKTHALTALIKSKNNGDDRFFNVINTIMENQEDIIALLKDV